MQKMMEELRHVTIKLNLETWIIEKLGNAICTEKAYARREGVE